MSRSNADRVAGVLQARVLERVRVGVDADDGDGGPPQHRAAVALAAGEVDDAAAVHALGDPLVDDAVAPVPVVLLRHVRQRALARQVQRRDARRLVALHVEVGRGHGGAGTVAPRRYALAMAPLVRDFPLFPLGLVALPSELIPLHIFEERYKTMMARVLEEEGEFGIVWVADDGLRPVGCACEIAEVLERMPDGRLNLVARGTRAFRIEARQEELAYPAGTVEFLDDRTEEPDAEAAAEAHAIYAELVEQATDRAPDADEIGAMSAYEMAATVEFGLEAKQGLLDLRSETARLRLVTRLFRGAIKRLDFVERAQARARSNGKVHFERVTPERRREAPFRTAPWLDTD